MLRRWLFGRFTITTLTVFVLAAAWFVWWSAPSSPAEIVEMDDPRAVRSDFGPCIPVFEGLYCGTGVDFSKLVHASDRTWTVTRQSDDSLLITEPGASRLNRKLPPADYRWIAGSNVGRRLAAQVGDHFHVWDVERGALLHRWPAPAQKYQMAPSGRHISTFATHDPEFEVFEVDSGKRVVHLNPGAALEPSQSCGPRPSLAAIEGANFSLDGHWLMLLPRDADNRCWLWLWDLGGQKPVWLQAVAEFRNSIAGSPNFDQSGRYFTLACAPPYSLLDLSTSPPTDLSELVAGVEPNVMLANRRAMAVIGESDPLMCRIWDLDARRQIGNYPIYCFIAREPIRSPDNRLIIVTDPPKGSEFDEWVNRIWKWLGRPIGAQACYRVVDLQTGDTVNRFVSSDRPTQFDADLQSVWCHSCSVDDLHERWLRYPLRSGGPPWWLWGATALGGLVVARNGMAALRTSARQTASSIGV